MLLNSRLPEQDIWLDLLPEKDVGRCLTPTAAESLRSWRESPLQLSKKQSAFELFTQQAQTDRPF
jgi:hypothetical protein